MEDGDRRYELRLTTYSGHFNGLAFPAAQELAGKWLLSFNLSLGAARGNQPTLAPLGVLSRQLLIAGQPYEVLCPKATHSSLRLSYATALW